MVIHFVFQQTAFKEIDLVATAMTHDLFDLNYS
jgi:hypothetical protein